MICIYCLENKNESSFQHTEHVIPRAFGTFEQNLTLNRIVCDDCNQYFGDNIELYLGRDSLEGISRYHYGIRSSKVPLYRRIKMKLGIKGELEGVHVFS
jgi:protein-arginine kinase activator protein McsA